MGTTTRSLYRQIMYSAMHRKGSRLVHTFLRLRLQPQAKPGSHLCKRRLQAENPTNTCSVLAIFVPLGMKTLRVNGPRPL